MLYGVIEKRSMHGFTYFLISAEAERDITYSPTDVCIRKIFTNPFCRLEKIQRIVSVFLNSRGNGKNIRIENNILRCDLNLIDCNLALTPDERLLRHDAALALALEFRKAGALRYASSASVAATAR